MLRSTEYSILHRNERFMKKAVILYVPWTLSAYSLLFFQMSVLRFLFPPRERGVPDAYVDALLRELHRFAPDAPLLTGHPLFRRRHAQPADPGAGQAAHPGSRPRARCRDHLGGKPRDRHRGEPVGLPGGRGEPHLLWAQPPGTPSCAPLAVPTAPSRRGSLCRRPACRVREHQRRHHAGAAPLYAGRV